MQALLSFDKAPPFAAPLRFFLTAPLFALAAGLLLAVAGPSLLASRWVPGLLGATHLITVGFMMQVMLGALIQILPVVAGANLASPLATARWLHAGLSAGAVLLACAFLFVVPSLFTAAAATLGVTVAGFLVATGRALRGVPSTSPTIRGLKLALVGLAGAVGLGVLLTAALAGGWALPLLALTDLHAAWALGAWAGVLLVAMAYVVVPMFQLTPGYPARTSWRFPWLILGLVLAWSVAVAIGLDPLVRLAQGLTALAGIAFAALTLRLQAQRRRARTDATQRFWQIGLASVILALAMVSTAATWPAVAEEPAWPLVAGALLLVGGFMSFIVGMLYKIVPFLAWLHLRNCGDGRMPVPNMNRILGDAAMQRQCLAHLLAVILLPAAAIRPDWLARPAGVALALASGWLFGNLLLATLRYRRYHGEIMRGQAAT
jgi:hypothetical protein